MEYLIEKMPCFLAIGMVFLAPAQWNWREKTNGGLLALLEMLRNGVGMIRIGNMV